MFLLFNHPNFMNIKEYIAVKDRKVTTNTGTPIPYNET